MYFSFWEQNSFIKSPDVIIIGSGIVGLNAALAIKIKEPKLHVIILERGILPYGASTRNAGFACYGSASELLDDLENNSADEVFSIVEKRWKGLLRLRAILGDDAIDYEPLGGHEIFNQSEKNEFQRCEERLSFLNKHLSQITGEKEMYVKADEKIQSFGFKNISHLILNKGEGQIDTGKMMKALLEKARSAGVEILNGVNVDRIESDISGAAVQFSAYHSKDKTESIKSKRVLICVNGFAKKFLPEYDVKAARAQVLITSPIENLSVKGSFHFDHGYYYFRNVGSRILFGGGRNMNFNREFTEDMVHSDDIQSHLEELLHSTILPDKKFSVEMRWTGIMGLGASKSPIIKKTSENIFCAVRMGGMGIAIGSLVGEEAADMVLESL
jgi:glycine/D-amino acid oxidase-like deaminating enzyme